MGHIFLSYSRKDIHMMQRLRDDLRTEGLDVWTDESLITGSQSWKQDVEEAIENASALVVVLTPNAKKSTWVREEMNYAEAQDVRIFPVLASGTPREAVPFGFITAQWVDFRKPDDYTTELQKLIFTLRGHLALTIAEEDEDDDLDPVTKVFTASDVNTPRQKTTLAPDAPTRQRRNTARVFPRNISKAIMVLQNRDSKWWRRVDAINHLAELRNPITLPVLRAYLDDADIDVQNAAAKAIEAIQQGAITVETEEIAPEYDETAVRRHDDDDAAHDETQTTEMPIVPTDQGLNRLKLVVTGPTDDLRTRFIRAVSEIKPVSISRDLKAMDNQHTTASMSMGRITVTDDLMVYLFGMPGQHHFDFMWKVLSEGMLGFIFVVDSTAPHTFRDAKAIFEKFRAQANVPYVIAADNYNKANAWRPIDIRIAMRLGDDVKVVPCISEKSESVKKVLLELIYHISDDVEG